jgi:hypothetical protein
MDIIDDSTLKLLSYKAVDGLYEYYEVRHSLQMGLYLRCNGDTEYPGEFLTKEEFPSLISESAEWQTAYEALFQYMVKQFKIESKI